MNVNDQVLIEQQLNEIRTELKWVVEKGKKKLGEGEVDEVDTDYISSEYAISDELRSLCTTDDEGELTRRKESSRPQFNMEDDLTDPHFARGMRHDIH